MVRSALRTDRPEPWYSFLLEAESILRQQRGRKDYVSDITRNRTRDLPTCSAVPQPTPPLRAMIVDDTTSIRFKYLPNETTIVSHYSTNVLIDRYTLLRQVLI